MAPKGGGAPTGDFLAAIERDFKDFNRIRRQLTEVASSIMGSGWAALVWEPIGKRLLITQIYDHQSNLAQAGFLPNHNVASGARGILSPRVVLYPRRSQPNRPRRGHF